MAFVQDGSMLKYHVLFDRNDSSNYVLDIFNRCTDLCIHTTIEEADVVISSLTLNSILKLNQAELNKILQSLEDYSLDKVIYILNTGDFAAKIPASIASFPIRVLSCGGHNELKRYVGFPAIWEDPIGKYIQSEKHYIREKK